MAKFNIHAAHNYYVPGANGYLSETKESRLIKNKVIALLRAEGHTVYDCTDEEGRTVSQNLVNIVNKCNEHKVDLDISIHLNAYNSRAYGTEILQNNDDTNHVCERLCTNISNLGFKNRGTKECANMYLLNKTKSNAILIECFFCDNYNDVHTYDINTLSLAIVEAILNEYIVVDEYPSASQFYSIRKVWRNDKSQLGTYMDLNLAKANCPVGYTVFDWTGKAVFANVQEPVIFAERSYSIRKSYNDINSQLGTYMLLDKAQKNCPIGYSVYNWKGELEFTNSRNNNIGNLDRSIFIEYVGSLSREAMKVTNIPASIIIAQSIIDSSWGTSEMVREHNCLIDFYSSGYKDFESIEESIKEYCNHLSQFVKIDKNIPQFDYKQIMQTISHVLPDLNEAYEEHVISIIKEYDLDVWDMAANPSELDAFRDKLDDMHPVISKVMQFLERYLLY